MTRDPMASPDVIGLTQEWGTAVVVAIMLSKGCRPALPVGA